MLLLYVLTVPKKSFLPDIFLFLPSAKFPVCANSFVPRRRGEKGYGYKGAQISLFWL